MGHSIRSRLSLCKDVGNRELVCPRPRHAAARIASGDAESCRPVMKLTSSISLPVEGDPGREILDILLHKTRLADRGSPRSLTPFLYGSPPVRASNPLIHDVHFTQKKDAAPPLFLPQNFSCRSGGKNSPYKKQTSCGSSFGSKPFVRIEGFPSSASDAREVPAFA